MNGRYGSNSSESYRYGYQGSERDDELKGEGNSYVTHYRMLDPRLGRWLSTDPEEHELPDLSPYNSMGNNPILHNDPEGDIFGVDNLIGAAIGAAIEAGTQIAVNAAIGKKDIFDLDYADIAVEAAVGFATSGIGNLAKAGKTTQRLVKAANTASKAVNSNKTLRTVAKVSKATGAGKNATKALIDVKSKNGKLTNESVGKGKSGSDAAVDFVGGIVGDGVAKVGNVLATDKAVRAAQKAVTKSNRGIPGTAAQKAYEKTATHLKAKASAKGAPASILSGAASGSKGDDVKRKQKGN